MQRSLLTLLLLTFALMWHPVSRTGHAAEAHGAGLKVTTKRPDDSVDFQFEKEAVTVNIHSPSGISQATFRRSAASWPQKLTIRLHLQGLEHFSVSNGKFRLNAAVSQPAGTPVVRLWKDDREHEPLDAKSPEWMEIRLVTPKNEPPPRIPLKPGWFEMQLPQSLLRGNPDELSMQWIDFYRQ